MRAICARSECGKEFYSKHSTAKYCSRECSGTVNIRNLSHRNSRKYSDEQLLEAIRNFHIRTGRVPSKRDFDNIVDSVTYRKRFGSWSNAIMMAGLVPRIPFPPSFLVGRRRTIRMSLRFSVLKRDGFKCRYCGGTPNLGYLLHVDHIDPSGPTEEWNLVTSCWICNVGKSDIVL